MKRFLQIILSMPSSLPPIPTDMHSVIMIAFVWFELHVNENSSLCVNFAQHVLENQTHCCSIPFFCFFFFTAVQNSIMQLYYIHSPADGCFQHRAITNKDATEILMSLCVDTFCFILGKKLSVALWSRRVGMCLKETNSSPVVGCFYPVMDGHSICSTSSSLLAVVNL